MSVIKFFIILILISFGKVTYSQPDPEYNILFNIQKDGKILNDANSKFRIYKSCDKKKRKLKQSNYLNTSKVMGGSKVFRRIRVLSQYLSCEGIMVKVNHGKEEMAIHFRTNQTALYNKFYLHKEIDFVPGKSLEINLGDNVEDAIMGSQAIGSSEYKWVLHPVHNGIDSLFERSAKLTVDSIIYAGFRELTNVQFKMKIGIDSLNRRFPQFCYNQCAKRLIYSETFEVYRLNDLGNWIRVFDEAGLFFPIATLCENCDLSKVIDDANAYEYFHKLKYDFSLNFKKYGIYKMACKMDSTINTVFTISAPIENSIDTISNQVEIDKQNIIGNWELTSFSFDTIINQSSPPEYFKAYQLSLGKKGELKMTRGNFENNLQGSYILQGMSLVFYFKTTNDFSGITPRAGPDAFYTIERLDDKVLILTQEGGVKYGTFKATYMKY